MAIPGIRDDCFEVRRTNYVDFFVKSMEIRSTTSCPGTVKADTSGLLVALMLWALYEEKVVVVGFEIVMPDFCYILTRGVRIF